MQVAIFCDPNGCLLATTGWSEPGSVAGCDCLLTLHEICSHPPLLVAGGDDQDVQGVAQPSIGTFCLAVLQMIQHFFFPQEEMTKMSKGRGGPSVASLNNVLMQVGD